MKDKLDLIETRLRSLIEGSISMLLPRKDLKQSLAHELVEAMHAHLSIEPDGRVYAPSIYIIHVNPVFVNSWFADASALKEIAGALEQAAHDAGFLFSNTPSLQLLNDGHIQRDDFRIETATPDSRSG